MVAYASYVAQSKALFPTVAVKATVQKRSAAPCMLDPHIFGYTYKAENLMKLPADAICRVWGLGGQASDPGSLSAGDNSTPYVLFAC